jgi:hypothetical protein
MNEIFIPQDITKWGILTSFGLFGFTFIAYKYKCYFLAIVSLCLFITSILHWHRQTLFGPIKIIDMLLVGILFSSLTFYYKNFFKTEHRTLWNITALLIVSIFIINSIIIYYQLINKNKTHSCQSEYNYFSLNYTDPNTDARTLSYYYTTFVHLSFVHILPGIILAYCFISSTFYTF